MHANRKTPIAFKDLQLKTRLSTMLNSYQIQLDCVFYYKIDHLVPPSAHNRLRHPGEQFSLTLQVPNESNEPGRESTKTRYIRENPTRIAFLSLFVQHFTEQVSRSSSHF